jgi:hypothetical protein
MLRVNGLLSTLHSMQSHTQTQQHHSAPTSLSSSPVLQSISGMEFVRPVSPATSVGSASSIELQQGTSQQFCAGCLARDSVVQAQEKEIEKLRREKAELE